MGQWGFYDDEGDSVADYAYEIEKRVLPKHLKNCYEKQSTVKRIPRRDTEKKAAEIQKRIGPNKRVTTWCSSRRKTCDISYETDASIECYSKSKEYMQKHFDEIFNVIKDMMKEKEYYRQDHMVAGIAMYMARNWGATPILPKKFGTVTRGFTFPKLPKKFPTELKRIAHGASVKQYKTFTNEMEWKDPKKRLQALKDQIKLFS